MNSTSIVLSPIESTHYYFYGMTVKYKKKISISTHETCYRFFCFFLSSFVICNFCLKVSGKNKHITYGQTETTNCNYIIRKI